MFEQVKFVVREMVSIVKHRKLIRSHLWEQAHEQSMIIMGMHTIEKGLSLKDPRSGFGTRKIATLQKRMRSYIEKGWDKKDISIKMAMAAIDEYITAFSNDGTVSTDIIRNHEWLKQQVQYKHNDGGVNRYSRAQVLDFDSKQFQKAIITRHSLRNFSEEDIRADEIRNAIEVANQCPSACNRQPTRVHLISSEEGRRYLVDHLTGTGGFAENCKMFIIITGTVTAFDVFEDNQWILNAGIFTGYLTLTLHSLGIGSCIIQRPFVRSALIMDIRKTFQIPDNEEIMCVMAIGKYPDNFTSPVSRRLSADKLMKIH